MGYPLSVENMTWSFSPGGEPFLRIPSLEVDGGSVAALTGPSGAGKSTLLFLLAGMEKIDEGRLSWGTANLSILSADERDEWRRRHVGMIFQDFQLIPEMSALKNVLLPFTFTHFTIPADVRGRAEELLHTLGIARSDALASTLSRGEMQRVSIARTLLKEPDIILADEPTASLDAKNEEMVMDMLLTAARGQGATLIISTHHQAVQGKADAILELSHGVLVSGNKGGRS